MDSSDIRVFLEYYIYSLLFDINKISSDKLRKISKLISFKNFDVETNLLNDVIYTFTFDKTSDIIIKITQKDIDNPSRRLEELSKELNILEIIN